MTIRSALTAAATSVALAFSGATPAAADPDNRDLIAFLAGIAALSIIANSGNAHTFPAPAYPRPVYPRPVYPLPVYPRPVQPRPIYSQLPGQCAIKVQTKYGWEKVYTPQCLWRAGYTRPLPQQCAKNIRSSNGWSQVYADYCLRQNGY